MKNLLSQRKSTINFPSSESWDSPTKGFDSVPLDGVLRNYIEY